MILQLNSKDGWGGKQDSMKILGDKLKGNGFGDFLRGQLFKGLLNIS